MTIKIDITVEENSEQIQITFSSPLQEHLSNLGISHENFSSWLDNYLSELNFNIEEVSKVHCYLSHEKETGVEHD